MGNFESSFINNFSLIWNSANNKMVEISCVGDPKRKNSKEERINKKTNAYEESA